MTTMKTCPHCGCNMGGEPQYRCRCLWRCIACGALCTKRARPAHLAVRHDRKASAAELEAAFRRVNYHVAAVEEDEA